MAQLNDLLVNGNASICGDVVIAGKLTVGGGAGGGSGFDFDSLIDSSGYTYTYTKSSKTETVKVGSTTYATRVTASTSNGYTVTINCASAGVSNLVRTYVKDSSGNWTVS